MMGWRDAPLKAIKDAQKFPSVEVLWRDAVTRGGWRDIHAQREERTLEVRTVGRMIKATPDEIVIIQSISKEGQCSDSICIPRRWVTRITRLMPQKDAKSRE